MNITTNIPLVSPIAGLAKHPRDVRNQQFPAQRIVVHITGTATYINAAKRGVPPLDHLEDYFDDAGHPFAHYSVDPWGRVRCHAPECETPWAQGWSALGGREKLLADLCERRRIAPLWWQREYQTRDDENAAAIMKDLFPAGTPNDRAIAVEFIQWQKGYAEPISNLRGAKVAWVPQGPKNYKLTAAQYLVGNMLLRDIALRHEIEWPWEPEFRAPMFLGHEDCDPWGRGTKAGGWDPGALRSRPRFCWACMLFLEHVGTNECGCAIGTPPIPPSVSGEPYLGIGRTGDCDCADDFTCAEHGSSHLLRDHK